MKEPLDENQYIIDEFVKMPSKEVMDYYIKILYEKCAAKWNSVKTDCLFEFKEKE